MQIIKYLAVLLPFALSACGGSDSSPGASTPAASAPVITAQPADQSVTLGATAAFSVTASGTAPLTYQWAKSGTAIPDATAAAYTTPATAAGDDGAVFAVTVSNSAGSVTSSSAKLSVTSAGQPSQPGTAGTDVLTYKNDIARSGLNHTETVLTTSNVRSSTFGLKRRLAVDGKVDAQPLYLSQLSIDGTPHNVVVVATEHDSVYGFDADSGAQLWKTSLLLSGESTSDTRGCGQVTPEIGITATPVIDRGAGHGTIYVVAMSKDGSGNYHQRLHALDATTGSETASATEIAGMVTTAGGGTNAFEPGSYEERAALLLSGGTLYLSFTSHCDISPYSGWVMAYKQSDLSQAGVINVGPNSNSGPAIWMSGGGPAADAAGNVYLLTANGAFETTLTNGFPSKGDFGNSFVKITNTNGTLAIADYFAVMNTVAASAADQDLGSGSAMLLPDITDSGGTVRHLVVGAGKDGNLYVVNRDNMGKFSPSANNIYQQLGGLGGIFSSPAYYNNMVFFGPINDSVKQYVISGGKLQAGAQTTTSFAFPGSAIAISANGTTQGIVWAHQMNGTTSDATLHAYLAGDLTEIYNSSQAAGNRDHFGVGNKFITPTIADGKVFVGTTNSVAVFTLL